MNVRDDETPATSRFGDFPFALAAFLGSSLVFLVQPMIAKRLLPTLGGAPAVWTTCVLFFQLVLLLGYAWAHLGPRWLGTRRHATSHVVLLAVACCFLPLGIARGWQPIEGLGPIANVLWVLSRSIGLPLVVLCATSPLIQRWHVAVRPARGDRVYRLYAIGNVASLLVLLAYPLAIEPKVTIGGQLAAWSVGFVALSVLLVWLAWIAGSRPAAEAVESTGDAEAARVGWATVLAWIALSAIPSSLLLGVTTFLTSDVTAVPFLWVLPLTFYLGAFSLAFAGLAPWAFFRHAVGPGLAVSGLLVVGAISLDLPVWLIVALRTGTFFLLAWTCLAALYERRPSSAGLTAFYLWIAVGGAIGGAFNSLVAPVVFNSTAEYPLATLAAAAIACFVARRPAQPKDRVVDARAIIGRAALALVLIASTVYAISGQRVVLPYGAPQVAALMVVPIIVCWISRFFPIASCVVTGLMASSVMMLSFGGQSSGESHRSFFGVHRVITPRAEEPGDAPFLKLLHGTTIHGLQRFDTERRLPIDPELPLAYYHRAGVFGELIHATSPRRIGVVGLGSGTIAAYVGAGQHLTFFEIDQLVVPIADGHPFTFLPAARQRGATVDIVVGDARLTLARTDAKFDLLILDAFSGDSVPAHLLTREAFELYGQRLSENGTLAVHISNRYLDLSRVVAAGAQTLGRYGGLGDESTWFVTEPPMVGTQGSTWVYVTREASVASKLVAPHWQPLGATTPQDAWTDDFSNLLHTLR